MQVGGVVSDSSRRLDSGPGWFGASDLSGVHTAVVQKHYYRYTEKQRKGRAGSS